MPIPKKYIADFEEDQLYHIYNRTNNKEPLFLDDGNRLFFLRRYNELLTPFVDTWCWCLLSNHFHLLVKIKPVIAIRSFLLSKSQNERTGTEKGFIENKILLSELIERTFKRFFQSYALALNKTENREGNLFYKPFKRIRIENDPQLTMAIVYIHANALKHGLVKDFSLYEWSSWKSILSNKPTLLARQAVIDWFGNVDAYVKAHFEMSKYYYDCEIAIED